MTLNVSKFQIQNMIRIYKFCKDFEQTISSNVWATIQNDFNYCSRILTVGNRATAVCVMAQ